jgi:hypothetical protein
MPRPNWYPNWQGETCAIIASGPSTKRVKVDQLRGRMRVIAIKENSQLAPWAECVYGCDAAWWRNELGLPKYNGLRVSVTGSLTMSYPDIHIAKIIPHNDHLLLAEKDIGTLGSGGNSGFQALNLALQFGARRVLLIGFDMSDEFGQHWYGPNKGNGRTNPGSWNFGRWRKAFDKAAQQLNGTGIEVLNASEFTSLKCFPKVTVEQALERWK